MYYSDVGPLIAGPGDIYICGECIELCQAILMQERRRRGEQVETLEEETQRREARERIATCLRELVRIGCRIVWSPAEADLAVAPLLQRVISDAELAKPRLGTLIFHPSLLPRHRGRDAIRWAYHLDEKYTGATWFWADSGLDTGEICEQEVVAIPGKRPRDFYEQDIIPVCVRLLRFAVLDMQAGVVRRRPQNESAATYEPPFKKK